MRRFALLFALVNCADLVPLAHDVCGNNILEAGEDCDRVVDPALGANLACSTACRIIIDTAHPRCPTGWGVRQDGVCHHAFGEYQPVLADSRVFESTEMILLRLADSRSLGILIASDREASLLAVQGGRAELITTMRYDVELSGRPIAGDFDGDGIDDAVLPTTAGLIPLRGLPGPSMSRVDFPLLSFGADVTNRFWLLPFKEKFVQQNRRSFLLIGNSDEIQIDALAPGGEVVQPTLTVPVSLESLGDRMPIVNRDGNDELILAPRGAQQIWIVGTVLADLGGTVDAILTATIGLDGRVIDRGAIVGDVDGDQFEDLLISVTDNHVLLARGSASGFQSPIIADARFRELAMTPPLPRGVQAKRQRFPLAPIDLDGDPLSDFVGADGVYTTIGTTALERADLRIAPKLPFDDAVSADFNHDGRDDFAAVAFGLFEIHVWLQSREPGLFTKLVFGTLHPPRLLRAGDFDGDSFGDVAFVESSGGSDLRGDAISALFGGPGHPTLVGELAWFDRVERLESSSYYSEERSGIDAMDDLLVTWSTEDATTFHVAVLYGNPLRAPASPYRFGNDSTDPARVLLQGRSGLFAIAGTAALPKLYSLPVSPGLRFDRRPTRPTRVAELVDPQEVDLAQVAWFSLPEQDVVGAIEGAHLFKIPGGLSALLPPPAGAGSIVALTTADLDGDRISDLVIVHERAVIVRWGADLTGSPQVLMLDRPPLDAVVIEADGDPQPELAILDDRGIRLANGASEQSLPIINARRLAAGDVDGDGLDDLIALGQNRLEVFRARSHLGEDE